MQHQHFYTQMERRRKGPAAGEERERESVCERWRVDENGVGIHCKNGRLKKD
jgi:hypothetical protein